MTSPTKRSGSDPAGGAVSAVSPAAGTTTGASPIADLSYRGYDGPLQTRALRWWVISLAVMRPLPRKPAFWICIALGCLPYFFRGVLLYTQSVAGSFGALMGGSESYGSHLFTAMKQQNFFLFLIALMVGSGIIASDVRANAIQLYLSRPITRGDYLIGKAVGLFLPLYAAALGPGLLLYLYCMMTFWSDGFWDDPLLILRLLASSALPAVVYGSILLGASAWSKSAFMGGAVFAVIHLVSQIVSNLAWFLTHGGPRASFEEGVWVRHLSPRGVVEGLSQNIYGVAIKHNQWKEGGMVETMIPAPALWIVLALGITLVVLGLAAARMRIRAVEVVRG